MQCQITFGDGECVLNDWPWHSQAAVFAEHGAHGLTRFNAVRRGIFESHLAKNTEDILDNGG
jgi:hypothetical protein